MTRGVFVGLSTIDVVYRVAEMPGADVKAVAEGQEILVGGPATNAAVTFAYLGGAATLVTGIGRHPLGRVVLRELEEFAIGHVDLSPEFDEAPSLSSVFVLPDGRRSVISANAGRIGAGTPVVRGELLEGAAVVLVDGHFMGAAIRWASEARARRGRVVMDGGSWKPGTEELLRFVDVAICSADFRPPGCEGGADVVRYLAERGVGRIAVTNGDGPVEWVAEGAEGKVPVPAVDVVDTLGAGDVFHGAFCWFYGESREFVSSLERAVGVASESVRYVGTRAWMSGERRGKRQTISN